MCYAKQSCHSFNSPPGDRCVQAFVIHSFRKAPASISDGCHWSWCRQTPLLPLRSIQIPRSGVSFLERGLFLYSLYFYQDVQFRMNIFFLLVKPMQQILQQTDTMASWGYFRCCLSPGGYPAVRFHIR